MVRSDSYYSLYKEVLFLQAPEKPLQVENNAQETNTTSISLTWQEPWNGGSEISHYTLEWKSENSDGFEEWPEKILTNKLTIVSFYVSKLDFTFPVETKKTYYFKIKAHNQVGESVSSEEASVMAESVDSLITIRKYSFEDDKVSFDIWSENFDSWPEQSAWSI